MAFTMINEVNIIDIKPMLSCMPEKKTSILFPVSSRFAPQKY